MCIPSHLEEKMTIEEKHILNVELVGVVEIFNHHMLVIDEHADGFGIAYECSLEVYEECKSRTGCRVDCSVYIINGCARIDRIKIL